MGKALAFQNPVSGSNIAIITDAGGPGIMAVDECVAQGLKVKKFSKETIAQFEKLKSEGKIPRFATNLNPVDLTGSVTSEMFEEGIRILFEDSEIDGIIVLGLHHLPALQEDFVDRVAKLRKKYNKSVVACDVGETEMALHIRSRFDKLGIPSYFSPEDAARGMAALVKYGMYLKKCGEFDNYIQYLQKRKKS
jgi:acetyltransferase